MSDTPRTDEIARGNHVVPVEWAQELERELADALSVIGEFDNETRVLRALFELGEEEEFPDGEVSELRKALDAVFPPVTEP